MTTSNAAPATVISFVPETRAPRALTPSPILLRLVILPINEAVPSRTDLAPPSAAKAVLTPSAAVRTTTSGPTKAPITVPSPLIGCAAPPIPCRCLDSALIGLSRTSITLSTNWIASPTRWKSMAIPCRTPAPIALTNSPTS